MLMHILECHYDGDGMVPGPPDKDVDFFRLLQQRGVIDHAQFRELIDRGVLGRETEQWTQTHGDVYECRRRRETRPLARYTRGSGN